MTAATFECLLWEWADLAHQLEESRLEMARARVVPEVRRVLLGTHSCEDLLVDMLIEQGTQMEVIEAARQTVQVEMQATINRLRYRLLRSEQGVCGMVSCLAQLESVAIGSLASQPRRTTRERVRDYGLHYSGATC